MTPEMIRTGFSFTLGVCLVALGVLIADAATGTRSQFFDGSLYVGLLVGGWAMLYMISRKTTSHKTSNQRTERPCEC